MKRFFSAALALVLINSQLALGQDAAAAKPPTPPPPSQPTFTQFDLDIPGGTPAELVATIEKATRRPLNAIIPTAHADVQLPPLKMRNVTTPRLFKSLQQSSMRQVRDESGQPYLARPDNRMPIYQVANVAYGFQLC